MKGLAHVPALDGLRGVAVAGVVAYHLGYLQGGFLGVDLFFVLSGFLITSLVLAEWSTTGEIGLGQFWLRRGKRLLPALFAVLAAVAAYAKFVAEVPELSRIRRDGLATLFYVQNWHEISAGTNYWDQYKAPSPLQHMWSLAIEEQFYVVWPLVLLLVLGKRQGELHRNRVGRLLGLCVVLGVASALAMIIQHHPDGDMARVYYGTDTRAAAILIGAALACAVALWGHPRGRNARIAVQVAGVVAAAGLAATWVSVNGLGNGLYEGGFLLCGLAVGVIITAISGPDVGPLSRVLSWTPLRWLGAISYGLYLWHWPVIVLMNPDRMGFDGPRLAVLRAAVSLGLSIVSYLVVEQPIRRGRVPNRRLLVAGPTAFAACGALLFVATIWPPGVGDGTGRTKEAETFRTDETVPAIAADQRRILLVGDSGAYSLGKGLTAVSKPHDITVVNKAVVGCGMGDGLLPLRDPVGTMIPDEQCADWIEHWRKFINDFEPDAVLYFQAEPGGSEVQIDGKWYSDCAPEFHDFYMKAFVESLQTLTAGGAPVFVATTPYRQFYQAPQVRPQTRCRNKMAADAVEQVPGAHLLDLGRWTCPDDEDECIVHIEDFELRRDGLHFEGKGAEAAGEWLLDQMLEEMPEK